VGDEAREEQQKKKNSILRHFSSFYFFFFGSSEWRKTKKVSSEKIYGLKFRKVTSSLLLRFPAILSELPAHLLLQSLGRGLVTVLPMHDEVQIFQFSFYFPPSSHPDAFLKKGRAVVYFCADKLNYEEIKPHDYLEAFMYLFEKLLEDENVQRHGLTCICQMKHFAWKHFNLEAEKVSGFSSPCMHN
jgi:hypothetical protein